MSKGKVLVVGSNATRIETRGGRTGATGQYLNETVVPAMAVVAAGFTTGEADQLRRAMGAWRRPGVIDEFHRRLVDGMLARGL